MNIETMINSPAFDSVMNATEHLGPFHPNPKIDKAYKTLRLLGFPEIRARELIEDELARRNTLNQETL